MTRRVSGTLVVPAIVHGLFDFSVLSEGVTAEGYAGGIAPILAYPVVGIILLIRRHRIEPARPPGAAQKPEVATSVP